MLLNFGSWVVLILIKGDTKLACIIFEDLHILRPQFLSIKHLLVHWCVERIYGIRYTNITIFVTRELPNLDLPEDPPIPLEPLPVEDIPLPEPPKEKVEKKQEGGRFKEKRVKSLASDNDTTKVTFKKRKLGSGARNTRQREDEDWQWSNCRNKWTVLYSR